MNKNIPEPLLEQLEEQETYKTIMEYSKAYNRVQSCWNILKEKLKKEYYYEIVDYMNYLEKRRQ